MNFTVKELAVIFRKSEYTIRRWAQTASEGLSEIIFDGFVYSPEKDPAGSWLFKKKKLV